MSDDVNKDIQKAIQDAKAPKGKGKKDTSVKIPAPRTLQHGLDKSEGVVLSSPRTLIAEVNSDNEEE